MLNRTFFLNCKRPKKVKSLAFSSKPLLQWIGKSQQRKGKPNNYRLIILSHYQPLLQTTWYNFKKRHIIYFTAWLNLSLPSSILLLPAWLLSQTSWDTYKNAYLFTIGAYTKLTKFHSNELNSESISCAWFFHLPLAAIVANWMWLRNNAARRNVWYNSVFSYLLKTLHACCIFCSGNQFCKCVQ